MGKVRLRKSTVAADGKPAAEMRLADLRKISIDVVVTLVPIDEN
jgi:hypothetical protein